jgi:2-haloacid dehalogenase
MSPSRRDVLSLAAAAALAGTLAPPAAARADGNGPACKAIAFDAFPIFDPRPVAAAEALFPGAGANLMNAWRTRQFEYQWLRALSDRYVDFRQTTKDSLVFAARQTGQ